MEIRALPRNRGTILRAIARYVPHVADAASQGAALAVLPVNSVNDHQLLSDDVVTRVNTFGRNVERSGPPPARSRRRGRRAAP